METRHRKWMWWFLGALIALQVYFVRELLAAFLLFTVSFVVLGTIGLGVYLIDQARRASLAWVPRVRESTGELVEDFSKRLVRRPRSEPAQ